MPDREQPEEVLGQGVADHVIHMGAVVLRFILVPLAGDKAVEGLAQLHPRRGLDLDAVELAVLLGHQVVAGKVLHRGQDAVAVAQQGGRHLGHPHRSDLAVAQFHAWQAVAR